MEIVCVSLTSPWITLSVRASGCGNLMSKSCFLHTCCRAPSVLFWLQLGSTHGCLFLFVYLHHSLVHTCSSFSHFSFTLVATCPELSCSHWLTLPHLHARTHARTHTHTHTHTHTFCLFSSEHSDCCYVHTGVLARSVSYVYMHIFLRSFYWPNDFYSCVCVCKFDSTISCFSTYRSLNAIPQCSHSIISWTTHTFAPWGP